MANITYSTKQTKAALEAHLRQSLPELEVKNGPGAMLSVGQSPWIGCMVAVNGKTVTTMPMVHGAGMLPVFLLLALTGIGLVLYAALALPKQLKITQLVNTIIEVHAASASVGAASVHASA